MLRLAIPTALVLALPIVLVASPASADSWWQTGDKVSHDYHFDWPNTSGFCGDGEGEPGSSYVEVRKSDDTVWVKDICADGMSATAKVTTYDEAGHDVRHRKCRNPYGKGTWAKCDFNWEDNDATGKALTPGVYDGESGYEFWDYGWTTYFWD